MDKLIAETARRVRQWRHTPCYSATMKLRVRINQDENAGGLERREGVARPEFQASGCGSLGSV
jgi:hypothetical protein